VPPNWDLRARAYDALEASDLRRGPSKARLFSRIRGRTLFLGIGTGIDIRHFPPGADVTGIDLSQEMIRRAKQRCAAYPGSLKLLRMDAMHLGFRDDCFDTVVTSCTLCSVSNPAHVLAELYRVLRPGGIFLFLEHVMSTDPLLGLALNWMTLSTRRSGTAMNRDTLSAVKAVGFEIENIESVFLDIILSARTLKPGSAIPGGRSDASPQND
jgi:ubiquinone/menaquinone biosynthesis C-methylase UbiE